MSLECNMIRDIRKYETKVLGPFTKRQLICILVSAVYAIPLALLLPFEITDKFIAGLTLASPGILCGYIKIDGTPPEVFALRYIYKRFLTPGKRKWKNANPYELELRKIKAKQMGNKTDKKKIKYSKNAEFKIYR